MYGNISTVEVIDIITDKLLEDDQNLAYIKLQYYYKASTKK